MKTRILSLISIASLLAVLACQTTEDQPTDLELTTTDSSISGTFVDELGDQVVFESVEEAGSVSVTVALHGLILVGTADETGLVADLDGFADNGADTQMTDADRTTLLALQAALERDTNERDSLSTLFLHKFVSIWTEYPDTLDLRKLALTEVGRGTTKICWARYTYYNSTHDGPGSWVGGCSKDNWEDRSTYAGYVNNSAPYSAYTDGTIFRRDDNTWWGWLSGEIDHPSNYERAYGNCFANCGGGCQGSGLEFTKDCAHHDSCVRFGHADVSISCQDEFDSTIDDEVFNWDEPC